MMPVTVAYCYAVTKTPRSISAADQLVQERSRLSVSTRNYRRKSCAGCTPKKRVDAKIGTWNRFIITVKGEQVSVVLNGEKIIDSVRLPGMPESGPIGLQQHGEPLEFANLFIRELP